MKTYKVIAGLVAASIAMPSMVLAASPGDLILSHWDNTGSATTTTTVTPLDYSDGFGSIPYFRGNGDGGGTYHFLDLGSGIGLANGNMFATINSIETSDGHLADTLGIMQGNIASLTSAVGSLSVPDLSSINAKLAEVNANLYGTSTTMTVLNASTTNGLVPKSAWTAMQAQVNAISTTSPLKSYEGTTLRTGSFPIFKSATVASGVAVFNFTTDGNASSTSLCSGGVIQDSVSPQVSDATASYQMGWAWSNSNKTLTVTTNKLTTANILTGLLGQAAANASVVKVGVWCYA